MLLIASPILGFITALIAVFAVFLGIKLASKSNDGILKYYFYAIILSSAIATAASQREFIDINVSINALTINPIAEWMTRFASLFTMLAALERTFNYLQHNKWDAAHIVMLLVVIYFWVTNLFIPLVITSNGALEIKHLYSLALLIGIALSIQKEPLHIIAHARNAIVLFVLASLAFIFINPHSALDLNYTQGYISGLPRFFGLAPHATYMGLFAALAIWITLAYPYKKARTTHLVISLSLLALVLTQSKTIMATFILGLPFILYFLSKEHKNQLNSPITLNKTIAPFNYYGLILQGYVTSLVALFLALCVFFLFFDYQQIAYSILGPEKLHNLTTFTGRDVIWEITLAEFYKSPAFGYGMNLFSESFRESIGMINATDGHNQFIDGLGRSGLVGFSGLLLLYIYIIYYSFKFAARTKGLSLNLSLLLILYSITAVPITLISIGITVLPFYLLLFVISANLNQPPKNHITPFKDQHYV